MAATSLLRAFLLSSLIAATSVGYAQSQDPGKVDLEASELAAEIIGAPVSDPSGNEIGKVTDVSLDEDGQPDRLRVTVSSVLGFGERTVELRRGAYMLLRSHVVLELSADDLRSLPEVGEDIDEKRAD